MPYPRDTVKLEKWERALDQSVANSPANWDRYDLQIQAVTLAYNRHLQPIRGYFPADWMRIKAMVWDETGVGSGDDWVKAPMQIGVNGDPGLRDLLSTPQGRMILPPEYAGKLTITNVPIDPNLNIAAGVGYLFKRLAIYGNVPDTPSVQPAVMPHPALASHGHHGHRAHTAPAAPRIYLAITGWRALDFSNVALYYNAGDGNYEEKLKYAYSLIQKRAKAGIKP